MNKLLGGTLGSLFLLALLAACGGNPGTKVTVHPLNYAGDPQEPLAVAYQVAGGAWQRLLPGEDGAYSFYVPSGEKRYGVAVNCGGFFGLGNFGTGVVLQLTTDESTEPAAACMSMGPFVKVKGQYDASAVTGASWVDVLGDYDSYEDSSTSGTYEIMLSYGSARDLLVLATDASWHALAGKVYRNLDATQPFTQDVALTNADAPTGTHDVASFDVPSGWSGVYSVDLLTAGGAFTDEGELGTGSQAGGSYEVLPGLTADDLYLVSVGADDGGGDRQVMQLHLLSGGAPADVSPSLMDPWPGGYSVTASALPTFALDHPDAGVQFYQVYTIMPVQIWNHTVSKGWLAGADRYTFPDLTAVRGFEGSKGLSGEGMEWQVLAVKSSLDPADYLGPPQGIMKIYSFPLRAGAVINAAMAGGDFTIP
ncbi:hypothetical protein ACMC9I_11055 [Deinococcota bacterium DY0809b]